jgi:RNA polymerase sigma factor FliA
MAASIRTFGRNAPIPVDEDILWNSLKSNDSAAARERLFGLHFPLARRISARFYKSDAKAPIEFDELLQWASAGLLEAIDAFRPELGVPFRYFGSRRISGSILNGIAKHSEVNQQISHQRRIARERLASLKSGLGETGDLNQSLAILAEIAASLAIGMMLDDSRMFAVSDRDPGKDPYQSLAWKRMLKLLGDELANLAQRDQDVIRMHYLEGLGFEEIGKVFDLTKGRISQIHKAAIALLRKRLLKAGKFRLES